MKRPDSIQKKTIQDIQTYIRIPRWLDLLIQKRCKSVQLSRNDMIVQVLLGAYPSFKEDVSK